jgi:hypothetical protein
MGKVFKASLTLITICMLLASCGSKIEEQNPTSTDGQPSLEEIITDLNQPIWIGKKFSMMDATWKISNYKVQEKIGDLTPTKEAFHSVDMDIDAKEPMNLENLRFELIDVFGNKFNLTENKEVYKSIVESGRISIDQIPLMSSLTYKVTLIFEGLKKTQGLSIEIFQKDDPTKRLALIDLGL